MTILLKFVHTYCSQLWRPYLIKHIIQLERVQCRSIKFILNDYQSSYRSRLLTLHLLSLMYLFELYDIIVVIKSLKNPISSFDIYNFVEFHSSTSRLSQANKLIHHRSSNLTTHQHFFFNRVPRLWNVLPFIDVSLPTSTLHSRLKNYFGTIFYITLQVYKLTKLPHEPARRNTSNNSSSIWYSPHCHSSM